MTEEEVRKSMKDALGQSAAQSIQDQVESSGQLYARAQKDAGVGAAEGAQRIASYASTGSPSSIGARRSRREFPRKS